MPNDAVGRIAFNKQKIKTREYKGYENDKDCNNDGGSSAGARSGHKRSSPNKL
jgi:hypothetical protein